MSKSPLRWPRLLFASSGFIPLLGLATDPPDVMLLIYSLYVAAWFGRERVARWINEFPGGTTSHLIGCFLVSGVVTETLAWGNNYLKAAAQPALFHPQLFADLLIGVGFYGGWACAWWVVSRRFHFSQGEVFLVAGIQGIFFEQLGAVALAMVRLWSTQPFQAMFFGLYVLAVHGSAAGLGMAAAGDPAMGSANRSRHWVRFPLVILLMVALAFVGCELVALAATLFGGLPPKRSIVAHPLW